MTGSTFVDAWARYFIGSIIGASLVFYMRGLGWYAWMAMPWQWVGMACFAFVLLLLEVLITDLLAGRRPW